MNEITKKFAEETVQSIKNISRDNAVRYGNHDEGYSVTITSKDIKEATNRKRVDDSVRNSIVNYIKESGIDAKISDNNIFIITQPILAQKELYSLKEIKERESIVDDLNTKSGYELMNN